MDDDDELTIVVATAPGASALERDGMLHRLEEAVAIAVSDVAVEGYVTNGSTAPGEVRLVIAATDLAASETLSLVGDSVAELLADPDLAGWGPYSVNVTDEVHDTDEPAVIWDDVLPESEPEAEEQTAVDEFDLQAARERLEHDAEYMSGLRLSWLTALELEDAAEAEHGVEEEIDEDIEDEDLETVDAEGTVLEDEAPLADSEVPAEEPTSEAVEDHDARRNSSSSRTQASTSSRTQARKRPTNWSLRP